MIIRGGLVFDAIHKEPYYADIRTEGTMIAEIAPRIEREGEEVIDATGLSVYPGFVEAHCHLGLDGYGIGRVDGDFNETTDAITPHLRAIDSFNPQELGLSKALSAGVTTVCAGPGSANVIGGTFLCAKTDGRCVDDMIVKNPAAMKIAFGENPKHVYAGKSISVRMTTAAKLRETLFRAKEYCDKIDRANGDPEKLPGFDMKMLAMVPVIRGEIPLKAHAHRADDICTAIRIAKEFGVRMTLEHCTEGHLIPEEIARAGYPCAVGPTLTNATKLELYNKSFETPGVLARAGVRVSIITDAPVIPEEYLALCAGLAVKAGMDPFDALQAITINPARHIGVEDRVGSLEVGKDADIVLCDGDALISSTNVTAVVLNGRKVR